MYTQCPSCASVFRLGPVHLREAGGQVRCGLCNEAFDALATLSGGIPGLGSVAGTDASGPGAGAAGVATAPGAPRPPSPRPAASPGTGSPAARPGRERPRPSGTSHRGGVELPEAEPEVELEQALPKPRGRLKPLLWASTGLVLVLALLLHGAYLTRAELMSYPQLRPALQSMCAVLGCDLPAPREPDNVEVVQSEVTVHPRVAGLLQVRAVLRNTADYPLAYPVLRLRFTDLSGQEIAQRRFPPSQYLPGDRREQALTEGMVPAEPLVLELELPDPGERAAAFELVLE